MVLKIACRATLGTRRISATENDMAVTAKVPTGAQLSVAAAAATCESSNEGESFSIGVAYETGPWGVSATYFNGEEEGLIANAGDEDNEFYAVAASYTLGPGIRTSVTYLNLDLDPDIPSPDTAGNTASALVVGLHLGF